MKLDNFPRILWINLDRSADRRKNMEELFDKYNLDHIRIKAVDGQNVTEMENSCIENAKISRAENACTCSHIMALKYFVENMDDDKIIIFEDDISFEFLEYIPYDWSILDKNLPHNYDIIQLAVTNTRHQHPTILVKVRPNMGYYCSAAYLVTKKAAQKLVEMYYINETINLSDKKYATADSMITSMNSYSISIFSYQTDESEIHENHLSMHRKSKLIQLNAWKLIKNYQDKIDLDQYFASFAKN